MSPAGVRATVSAKEMFTPISCEGSMGDQEPERGERVLHILCRRWNGWAHAEAAVNVAGHFLVDHGYAGLDQRSSVRAPFVSQRIEARSYEQRWRHRGR